MRTTSSLREFMREPDGCQLVMKNFTYWFGHRGLTGFAVWGNPDRDDIVRLNAVMDVVLTEHGGPHRSFVDMSALAAVDPRAFRTMAEYLAKRWDAFGRLIQCQALIRPAGYPGAVVAGFYEVVAPTYPVKVFDDVCAAVGWLGIEQAGEFVAAIHETRKLARDLDPVVRELRAKLLDHDGWPSLAELAKQLGLSDRTLQRRLTAAHTSYRSELQRSKLEAAQALMLAGGASLTQIALELGFASLQHFSGLFRKLHGQSPSQWLGTRAGASRCEVANMRALQP